MIFPTRPSSDGYIFTRWSGIPVPEIEALAWEHVGLVTLSRDTWGRVFQIEEFTGDLCGISELRAAFAALAGGVEFSDAVQAAPVVAALAKARLTP